MANQGLTQEQLRVMVKLAYDAGAERMRETQKLERDSNYAFACRRELAGTYLTMLRAAASAITQGVGFAVEIHDEDPTALTVRKLGAGCEAPLGRLEFYCSKDSDVEFNQQFGGFPDQAEPRKVGAGSGGVIVVEFVKKALQPYLPVV
jgi:hypothetical protein